METMLSYFKSKVVTAQKREVQSWRGRCVVESVMPLTSPVEGAELVAGSPTKLFVRLLLTVCSPAMRSQPDRRRSHGPARCALSEKGGRGRGMESGDGMAPRAPPHRCPSNPPREQHRRYSTVRYGTAPVWAGNIIRPAISLLSRRRKARPPCILR